MSVLLDHAKEKIDHYGDIVFFEQIDSCDGVEIAAFFDEFKCLFEVGLSNIKKVAVLTDEKWIETVDSFESKLFAGLKAKCFSVNDQLTATMFLKEP